jgi:hypothetical protein
MNYVDASLNGIRGGNERLTQTAHKWLCDNVYPVLNGAKLRFIGTGPLTNDMIVLK